MSNYIPHDKQKMSESELKEHHNQFKRAVKQIFKIIDKLKEEYERTPTSNNS